MQTETVPLSQSPPFTERCDSPHNNSEILSLTFASQWPFIYTAGNFLSPAISTGVLGKNKTMKNLFRIEFT